MAKEHADIGVFGGSGFYSLIENPREVWIETPYGLPSDKVALGEIAGKSVAFLPRHGKDHRFPPQSINYRANAWAMKELGVTRIIGPTACGSLKAEVKPGDMVVADQIVDRTTGRKDSFYDGPITTHVSFADPYCAQLRPIAVEQLRALDITTHDTGTIVVIQGPRFSTRAESKWFSSLGWEVINMTNYPESYLARELEMCYVNISLITDYDVGLEGQHGIEPVSHAEVMKIFAGNNERVKNAIFKIIEHIPAERTCACGSALAGGALSSPVQQLRGVDLLMYVRAFGLLVRNPSIIVVPLLMGIIGVFVGQIGGNSGGGIFGSLTAGIASLLVLLLQMFAFGTACIIADAAWRRGRASFDEGWNEARRKGGEILTASLGFTFILYAAGYAGSLIGPLAPVVLALAVFFLIYTIPAAAIGGIPGGASIQISIERARYNPVPTVIVTIVSVAAFLGLGLVLAPLFTLLLGPLSFASLNLLEAVFSAVVQAIAVGYIALVVSKTYADVSFGRRL